jgi:hypothetical protein
MDWGIVNGMEFTVMREQIAVFVQGQGGSSDFLNLFINKHVPLHIQYYMLGVFLCNL